MGNNISTANVTNRGEEMNPEILKIFEIYGSLKDANMLYGNYDLVVGFILLFIKNEKSKSYDQMMSDFKSKYICSEMEIEKSHTKEERTGLSRVYDYIQNKDPEAEIGIASEIRMIHQILWSDMPHPEAGGELRTIQLYLPGSSVELSLPENVIADLCGMYDALEALEAIKEEVNNNPEKIIEYIREATKLTCNLIKIHPFLDGNGRTMRAFLNYLFKRVEIPPTYILPQENEEYRKAMELAMLHGDYSKIEEFYLYKVCDSIAELNYGIVTADLECGPISEEKEYR